MELVLQRNPSLREATIGRLSLDGDHLCYTLEDVVREVPGEPVETWKVRGKTAIPAGRYRVIVTMSPRFGRALPLLCAVPGFDGVRIHPGNTAADTEGCILVGVNVAGEAVVESRKAYANVFGRISAALEQADGEVWLDVRAA